MAEQMKVGNGIVAPLTYEIIEEAEAGRSRMMEAIKKGELNTSLLDRILEAEERGELEKSQQLQKDWLRITKKYYQTQPTEE